MSFGVYISIPFCRTKCTFCNFASGVAGRAVYKQYVDRVCHDIQSAKQTVASLGARLERRVDSVYLGGGTPTMLDPADLRRLFAAVHATFEVESGAEITVECAPGTLSPEVVDTLVACGVNRVSLGVQSWVDKESSSVGRLHTRKVVLEDLSRLRRAGIENISIDLIAGLPHQNAHSWRYSLEETIACGAPHVSVYMLEVDEDSRLGRELLAGGTRYHAHFTPNESATTEFYLTACETLESAGIHQYEISNFARTSMEEGGLEGFSCLPALDRCEPLDLPHYHSRHNLKYWTRQPYLGFGVDAHSMLLVDCERAARLDTESVRFSTCDTLEGYLQGEKLERTFVSQMQALEEEYFLGLRLNGGVRLSKLEQRCGVDVIFAQKGTIEALCQEGLLQLKSDTLMLTPRGRLLSNEVFASLLLQPSPSGSR